jgi:hypothetical protein
MTLLKLRNEAADPAAEVDTSILYVKDVQGASQVFARTEDGRVSQFTPARRVVIPGESLSGAIASSPEETIELLPGEHTLDADAENTVTLRFRRGAVLLVPVSRSIGSRLDFCEGGLIRPAADVTVAISGPVMMPDTAQCFDISSEGHFRFEDGTISYLTPCHFGALLDNTTDARAAIQAAIDSLPAKGGVVRFPLGDMVSCGQINVRGDHVIIEGMGWGSRLRFQTDVAATLFCFEQEDAVLLGCGIRNIRLSSNLPSGDVAKTAIDVHDAREFLAERIAILLWLGGAETDSDGLLVRGSIGLRVRGRDAGTYRKLFIHADMPILFDLNTKDMDQQTFRDVKDMDHHTFEDLDLIAHAPPNPVIKIVPGFVMRNTRFTGYQAWVQGGLKWVDDAAAPRRERRAFSNNVAIENVRAEQIGRHPNVFAVDIQKDPTHPLHELSLKNCLTTGRGGGWSGVRATGVENLVYDRTVRYEGAVTSLVADGTVDSGAPRGYLDGLRMTRKSVTEIEIGPGRCRSDDDRFDIEVTAQLAADLNVRGPGGRDRGRLAAKAWYSVWLIDKSNHGPNAPKLILSADATNPQLKGGFDLKRRLGWIRSDAAKQIRRFNQRESGRTREIWYDEPLAELNALTDGAALIFTDVSLASQVPPTAERVHLLAGFLSPTGGAPSDSLELRPAGAMAEDGPFHLAAGATLTAKATFPVEMPCSAAQAIEYKVTDADDRADLWVLGFDDDL